MSKTAIIGFGGGGYHAAKALREADPTAEIDIYTDTPEAPANPMLTTYYVAGRIVRDDVTPYGKAPEIAAQLGVNLYIERVLHLCGKTRTLTLAGNREKVYDNVVLATGSHPLVPPINGLPEDQKGVYVMRTLADADRLLQRVQAGLTSALVIGASWVGIKVVEALYAHHVPTTLADMAPRIFPTATLPPVADKIHSHLENLGIGLKFGSGIQSIRCVGDEMISTFADGVEIRTDIVALCMGLRPTVDIIDQQEFDMGRGLRVNEYMQTNLPHIYAIGDCCEAYEMITKQKMSVNLWANAFVQGEVAGKHIAGKTGEFAGNFIHNITHFLDMDFIGLGDNRSQGNLVTFTHPKEGWEFYAILGDEGITCVNILDNRRACGPAKAALIKRLKAPKEDIGPITRLALMQSGLPDSIIEEIGGVK